VTTSSAMTEHSLDQLFVIGSSSTSASTCLFLFRVAAEYPTVQTEITSSCAARTRAFHADYPSIMTLSVSRAPCSSRLQRRQGNADVKMSLAAPLQTRLLKWA
jgi:hypothetical protein